MNDDDLTLGTPNHGAPGRRPESWSRAAERWERPDDDYARWRDDYERSYRRPARRGPGPVMALVLIALLLGAVAFVVAPLFAFRAVRSAAQFGDVQALNEQVDFDAMRQSLRVQVRPASVEAAPPTSIFRNPLAALRRAWEPVTPQADVNTYLSAETLAGLMSGKPPPKAADRPPGGLMGGPFPAVRYWGFDRARLAIPAANRSGETVFTFQRKGWFTWRMVGVRLPPEGAPTPPPAPAAAPAAPEIAPPALDAQ